MEKKLNLEELLKDCPKGMELDCTLMSDVYFDHIESLDAYPLVCYTEDKSTKRKNIIRLTKYGCFLMEDNAKCVIFPKGKTTWEGFQRPFKDGEIVATYDGRWIGITEGGERSRPVPTYCVIMNDDKFEAYHDEKRKWAFDRLATEAEKAKLFKIIKDNGYRWDAEKKELKKIKQVELPNGEDYGIDSLYHAASILEKTLGGVEGYQSDDGILEHKCAIEAVKRLYKHKPSWSDEDEKILYQVQDHLREYYVDKKGYPYVAEPNSNEMIEFNWLKSLKERLQRIF